MYIIKIITIAIVNFANQKNTQTNSSNQKKKTFLNKKIYPFNSNTFNFFIRMYSRASLQLLTPLTAGTIII